MLTTPLVGVRHHFGFEEPACCCAEHVELFIHPGGAVVKMDLLVRDNNQAKSLVDFALHDLKGKRYQIPVYELLGGRTTEGAQLGWVLSAGTPDEVATEAKVALSKGFALLKMKTGHGTLEDDVAMVRAVRETVGPNVRLTVDANGFWTYEQALRVIRQLDA